MKSSTSSKVPSIKNINALTVLVGYTFAFSIFGVAAQPGYSLLSIVLASALFVVGTIPMVVFFKGGATYFPVIELVMLAYVNAFSLPILFEAENVIHIKTLYPDSEPVSLTLLLAIVGVCALWCGWKGALLVSRSVALPKLKLSCNKDRLLNYAALLALLALGKGAIDTGTFRGFANVVANQDVAIALLALCYYEGALRQWKKGLVVVLVGVLVFNGMSTVTTQAILQPLVIWFVCRWLVTRRFELSIIAVFVMAFVIIQPVKLQYRNMSQVQDISAGPIERVGLFSDLLASHWLSSDAISMKVDASTYNRSSLLLQTAHIVDFTPDVVAYMGGETFYFLVVTFIPRFVWPDKPTAQEANIRYALDYGVTTWQGTEVTMFGVGHLGEAFMNFGAIGIFPVFFVLGIFYFIPVALIKVPSTTGPNCQILCSQDYIAPTALLVAAVVNLLFIERSVADVFGGVVQLIVVQGGLMRVFASSGRSKKQNGSIVCG